MTSYPLTDKHTDRLAIAHGFRGWQQLKNDSEQGPLLRSTYGYYHGDEGNVQQWSGMRRWPRVAARFERLEAQEKDLRRIPPSIPTRVEGIKTFEFLDVLEALEVRYDRFTICRSLCLHSTTLQDRLDYPVPCAHKAQRTGHRARFPDFGENRGAQRSTGEYRGGTGGWSQGGGTGGAQRSHRGAYRGTQGSHRGTQGGTGESPGDTGGHRWTQGGTGGHSAQGEIPEIVDIESNPGNT